MRKSVLIVCIFLLLLSIGCSRGEKAYGKVTAVDNNSRKFTIELVNGSRFTYSTSPSTAFIWKRAIIDRYANLSDISIGQFVSVEFIPGGHINFAKEVYLFRND